eukprot:Blabericola_migrator_1__4447@NODE_2380_length_2853_cov_60_959440_g1490_i0_p4_GENE_NODE_2380_length_2853_cov_60_959440_g1490_i0NODE_2380_length_2853_cov_60_959440_g1490_i0_p4_ORF_typecomplete_len134_score26_32RNA_pol_Rpb4/PF03874_16/2e13_NODE_2380_length_2853_cov_60_959440_g1490_i06401041
MKVLLETSQPVTNIELYGIVTAEIQASKKELGSTATKDEIRYQTNLVNLLNYCLETRISDWRSEEACSQCLGALANQFDLRQFDLLQIANIVPRNLPELTSAIEQPEVRYEEAQLEEMLILINEFMATETLET